jgi:hypothetical protein
MTYSDYPKGPTGEVAVEDAGFLTRWMWVYFAPRKVFQAVAHRPAWLVPLVLLAVLSSAASYIGGPISEEYMKQRIEESERIPEEAKEKALERYGEQKSPIAHALRVAGGGVVAAVSLVIFGGILLFINNLILGGGARYTQMLGASCYISLVWIPSWIVKIPLMLIQRTIQVPIGPAALLPPEMEGSFGWALLTRVDLFGIWEIILTCVALSAIGGYSAKRASAAVVPLWVIWSILVAVVTWFGFKQIG